MKQKKKIGKWTQHVIKKEEAEEGVNSFIVQQAYKMNKQKIEFMQKQRNADNNKNEN